MMLPLIEHRIRWSGLLIACGLIIQMITLIWVHPLAFMAFLMIGCPLVGAGIFLFLYSIVSYDVLQKKQTSTASDTVARS
jgi:hypothetical protein